MKLKTKKTIAREGLIILFILFLGGLFMITGEYFYHKIKEIDTDVAPWEKYRLKQTEKENPLAKYMPDQPKKKLNFDKYLLSKAEVKKNKKLISIFNNIRIIGLIIFISGYPVCLLTRFVIWSIKTLRQKE
jgi:hypothetical protein